MKIKTFQILGLTSLLISVLIIPTITFYYTHSMGICILSEIVGLIAHCIFWGLLFDYYNIEIITTTEMYSVPLVKELD